MNYSLSGFCLAIWLLVLSATTCSADTLTLTSCSTNTLHVKTYAGDAICLPGQTVIWPVDYSTVNYFGTNGGAPNLDWTTNGNWLAMRGHDYLVTFALSGEVVVSDTSLERTAWFWFGLTTSLAWGFLALGARWVKRIFGGVESSHE